MKSVLRLACLVCLAVALSACSESDSGSLHSAGVGYPEVIALPDGFLPEGVVMGRGHTLYTGSLLSGAVYAVDLRSGAGAFAVPPQQDRIAVGMDYQSSRDRLFVAGGPGGAYVYDATSGETVASYLPDPLGFINDVIVTRDAAYFTDSFLPVLYVLPFAPNGDLPADIVTLPLSGDYQQIPPFGTFNANGIEASPDGSALILVNSAAGELYRVDPLTGIASLIVLGGGDAASGDGLLLQGRTLYVVQNFFNRIAVVELAPDLSSGVVIEQITDSDFDVPTTVTRFGNALYAVNARFSTPPTPDTAYQVVRVER